MFFLWEKDCGDYGYSEKNDLSYCEQVKDKSIFIENELDKKLAKIFKILVTIFFI